MPRWLNLVSQALITVVAAVATVLIGLWLWDMDSEQRPVVATAVLVAGATCLGATLPSILQHRRDRESEWRQAEVALIRELMDQAHQVHVAAHSYYRQQSWLDHLTRLQDGAYEYMNEATEAMYAGVAEATEAFESGTLSRDRLDTVEGKIKRAAEAVRESSDKAHTIIGLQGQLEEAGIAYDRSRMHFVYLAGALTDPRFLPLATSLADALDAINDFARERRRAGDGIPMTEAPGYSELSGECGDRMRALAEAAAARTRELRIALAPAGMGLGNDHGNPQ